MLILSLGAGCAILYAYCAPVLSGVPAIPRGTPARGERIDPVVEKWKAVHSGGRVDYRHCEAYQIAAAYMANVHLLPPEAELIEAKRQEAEQLKQQQTQQRENRNRRSESWVPTPME